MRRNINRWLVLGTVLLLTGMATANNLTVQNVTLSPSGGGKATIAFDLSWENSWRDAENFDAAWIFAKYTTDGGRRWRHATLAADGTNPSGFSVGTNTVLEIVVPADKKGAMVQRATLGEGDIATTNMQFVWDFANDGVSPHAQAIVEVMGIEMVYIPEGPFYVGDDANDRPDAKWQHPLPCTYINTSDMSKTKTSGSGTPADPYVNPAGCGRPGLVTGTFNVGYPNGYNAFYMAKYEMSEAQYVGMLNKLSPEQAINRYPDMANIQRHTITGIVSSTACTFTSAAPERAAGFFYFGDVWVDAAAYVDWAALRPATDMEFEKAARGPELPLAHDFAWGDTSEPIPFTSLLNDGTAEEVPVESEANANFNTCTPRGPIRCGAFATNGSDRVKSGAGYYGVMELSGNVLDRVISSGAAGQALAGPAQWPSFSGMHGDGELSTGGNPDVPDWPMDGNCYTGRGGAWGIRYGTSDLQVRIRRTKTYMYQNGYGGIRAVRTAP